MRPTIFLFTSCFFAYASSQATIQDCPQNVPRDRYLRAFGSSCYQFVVNHEREWPTAERECEARHGHLVIIRDAATNQFIYNELVQEFHVRDVVFIGLSDAESEGHWKWVDGSDPAYTNWASGQPGIGGTFEDCAAMDTSKGSTWHDYSCEDILFVHKRQKFICEYPAEIHTTTTTMTTTTTTQMPTTTTTTTPMPTTTTTTPMPTTTTTTTTSTTTTTTVPTTTTTTTEAGCPVFECSLDCGLDGYFISDLGCMMCECA